MRLLAGPALVLSLAVCLGAGNEPAPCALRKNLLYGMDGMAEKYGWVCCGNQKYAEPSGTMSQRSSLVDAMRDDERKGRVTTFYDASCGLPLFRAPFNRTLQQWLDESNHHGWPSFRPAEVIHTNIVHEDHGEVVSSCGTHLGHNIPDANGDRYCINLLCVAGAPLQHQSAVEQSGDDQVAGGELPSTLPSTLWLYVFFATFALAAVALCKCYSNKRVRDHRKYDT